MIIVLSINYSKRAEEEFNKIASVTGRQVRPPLLLQREKAAFCEESTECPLLSAQGLEPLLRLMEDKE